MQSEISKLEAAKKEHNKLLRSASLHEKQLQQLQRDLKDMKATKVKLMQQMKVSKGVEVLCDVEGRKCVT